MSTLQVKGDFSKLENLIKKLKTPYYCDVGILGEASYEDGATIAGIGAVHELGSISGNIPQRSFIVMPIETKQADIAKKLDSKWEGKLESQDIRGLFIEMGILCEAAIQEAFDTKGFGSWKPIEEATKKRKKGSDAILIDKGILSNSITSEVGQGGGK
jgi:phage gpG-like protein